VTTPPSRRNPFRHLYGLLRQVRRSKCGSEARAQDALEQSKHYASRGSGGIGCQLRRRIAIQLARREPLESGDGCSLCTCSNAKFCENVPNVCGNRPWADGERRSDVPSRQTIRDKLQDFVGKTIVRNAV